VLVAIVVARLVVPETLYYSPYPPNPLLPPFQPLVGLVLLLLTLPALLSPSNKGKVTSDTLHAVTNTEHTL